MNTQEDVVQQFAGGTEGYQRTELFGGAMTAELPLSFGDVSTLREVPDNQEVYLHRTQLMSVVFDILERVERPGHPIDTDEQALLYHYKDITEEGHVREGTESEEESQVWECGQITLPNFGSAISAYNLTATQTPHAQPPAAARSGKPPVNFTGILMTLLRLKEQQTDLVISINVPHAQGDYSPGDIKFAEKRVGPLMSRAREYQAKLLESFKIEDWGLFVQE
ncbi:MAG: hypothetical protein Q9162_003583 [Coniocarpon cinnabarinum]